MNSSWNKDLDDVGNFKTDELDVGNFKTDIELLDYSPKSWATGVFKCL